MIKKSDGFRILPIGFKWQSILVLDAIMNMRGFKGYSIPLITKGNYGLVLMRQKKIRDDA